MTASSGRPKPLNRSPEAFVKSNPRFPTELRANLAHVGNAALDVNGQSTRGNKLRLSFTAAGLPQ